MACSPVYRRMGARPVASPYPQAGRVAGRARDFGLPAVPAAPDRVAELSTGGGLSTEPWRTLLPNHPAPYRDSREASRRVVTSVRQAGGSGDMLGPTDGS